jgi:hypothetical protein
MSLFISSNFASGFLAATIGLSDSNMTMTTGHTLPTLSGNFVCVIWKGSLYANPSLDPNAEFVIASYSGTINVYNITRAQEGTLASPHTVGDNVTLVYSAGVRASDISYTVPSGGIIMWSGSIANIPSGWVLCNGLNGTPDLRNSFVVGAYQDVSGVANTTITGSNTVSGSSIEPTITVNTTTTDRGSSGTQTPVVISATATASGLITPPYYALAFIMKT